MNAALLLIDVQNDYFPQGSYPLWDTESVLNAIESLIKRAQAAQIPIIHIQHIADSTHGIAPFFNEGTEGANIHPRVHAAAPNAPVVVKTFADSFEQTRLQEVLDSHNIDTLLLAGMMTQNCVTHTALSRSAEPYAISVLVDCCTTVDEMVHQIALHALSTRVDLISSKDTVLTL